MRLPWFNRPLRRSRAATARRRRTNSPLGVRRLEHRRVLNATIQTAPPQIDPAVPVAVDEGTHVTATANVTGNPPFAYFWSLTQGMTNVQNGTDPTFEFDAPDDGLYTLKLFAGDSNQVISTASVDIQVNNVAPELNNVTGDTIVENDTATITATIQDPGAFDVFSVDVNWLDGTSDTISGLGLVNSSGTVDDTTFEWTATTRELKLTHTYLDDGPSPGNGTASDEYLVQLIVHDDDGDTGDAQTATVTVNNALPVLNVPPDQIRDEGQLLSFPGSDPVDQIIFTDAGKLDMHTAQIDWGDGHIEPSVITPFVGGGTIAASHTYADNGVYTVLVRVADDDMSGNFTSGVNGVDFVEKSFTLTVNNVRPTLTVPDSLSISIDEGSLLSIPNLGTITDPGFDNPANPLSPPTGSVETFRYSINWGDGTLTDPTGNATIDDIGGVGDLTDASFDGSHTYADNGVYTVLVRVADDDMSGNFTSGVNGVDFVEKSFTLTVNNVRPTLTVPDSLSISIDEGSLLSIPNLGTITDPGFDNPANPLSPPTGSVETFRYSINWGDGTLTDPTGNATIDDIGGVGDLTDASFDGSHTYADNGVYTVLVRVADDDMSGNFTSGVNGVDFVEKSFTLTVNNVRPTLTVPDSLSISIDEGSLLSIPNLGTITDPGFDNPANPLSPPTGSVETFRYSINWGDGTLTDPTGNATIDDIGGVGDLTDASFDGSHTYADNGVYTVLVRVADDDMSGNFTSGVNGVDFVEKSFTLTVNNVRPTLTVPDSLSISIDEGSLLSIPNLGTITDPGFDNPANPLSPPTGSVETFRYSINWGDGTLTDPTGNATIDDIGGVGDLTDASFDGSHTYADNGVYTVLVRVADDDMSGNFTSGVNGVDFVEKSFTLTVNNVRPTLTVPDSLSISIDEGSLLSIPNLGTITDPGFDNPANPLSPPTGSVETFRYSINWGDGTLTDPTGNATIDDIGGVGDLTDASFDGSHTYADNGVYTVLVRVADDDMSGNFTSGVNGVDFVEKSFTLTVNNVRPTLTVPDSLSISIDEGSLLSIPNLGTITDPGFDNPANPLSPPTGSVETFRYSINWGDGTLTDPTGNATIDDIGGVGDLTDASFDGSHTYADNGVYTVLVRVADDDMSGNFTSGVNGVDFVEKSFTLTVNNVRPTLTVPDSLSISIDEGSLLSIPNLGTITDPGFDNPANPLSPPTGSVETFRYSINWGDGTLTDPTGNATIDDIGGVGDLTDASFDGSHTYADNGVYTVLVRVADDDMSGNFTSGVNGVDFVEKSFQVNVKNVDPALTGTLDRQVNEGQAFTLTDLVIGLTDPGFDNPANPLSPPNGSVETFTGMSIDWGDGSATTPVAVVNRASGSEGNPTTAQFDHAAHTYADNGIYTVTVTVRDDDGPFVARTFTITVNNVDPILTGTANREVNEGQAFTLGGLLVGLSDPGFDNLANPLSPPNGSSETFTGMSIDWGDGTATTPVAVVNRLSGSVGVLTTAQFDHAAHIYADDGTYTVSVTFRDDDGPFVTRQFTIVVHNVAPNFIPLANGNAFSGTDVTSTGHTSIHAAFSDVGFDNPNDPNPVVLPLIAQPKKETFIQVVDWGDGTIDAVRMYDAPNTGNITVKITDGNGVSNTFTLANPTGNTQAIVTMVSNPLPDFSAATTQTYTFEITWGDGMLTTYTGQAFLSGPPLLNTGRTMLSSSLRTSGSDNVLTTGEVSVDHTYLGPPDSNNPTAKIQITAQTFDDNNGHTQSASILITNPGIDVVNVAIDTTPDVPRLLFVPAQGMLVFFGQQSNSNQGLQSPELRVARSELTVTADRYLELVVVYPDGTVSKGYRLKDEALQDLRGLFATLPDNRYRIYLVRTENNSRRLVMEVYVRNGRVIDPTDDSEGTRDRPPTSEQLQQPAAAPLDQNPLLEPAPVPTQSNAPGASDTRAPAEMQEARDDRPVEEQAAATAITSPVVTSEEQAATIAPVAPDEWSTRSLRWAAPLVGLSLGVGVGAWSRQIDAALEQADDRAWQRLRRAGRLGWPLRRASTEGRQANVLSTEYNESLS